MPWKYSEEYYRDYTRRTWDESSRSYIPIMERFAPFHSDLVGRLSPRPGERVLDMASGPGEPAIAVARRVAPTGRVLGVDLSERMVELATQRSRAEQVPSVEFRVMDCTRLELPDASFDAVTSAFGFQIFTDPERAAAEARRVVRPGGRIAVCLWGTAERVPFLEVLIGPMLEHAEPDETGYLPTPYETGGPGEMVRFLETAGFDRAVEVRTSHVLRAADPDDYLQTVLRGTPLGHSLGEEDPEVQSEILAATRRNLEAYRTPRGLELPAEVVQVTASG